MFTHYYPVLLTVHSYWRWVVFVALLAAVATGIRGWMSRAPFDPMGRRVCRLTVTAVDVQLLLGLCLYSISPLVHASWANMAAAMKQHELRFFSVEHAFAMLLAVAAAHVGAVRARRRAGADRSAYVNMAGWFGVALACVVIGLPYWRPYFRAWSWG